MSRERPSHECFVVEEREGAKKAYWTRIGSAWPHKDGKGFNVQLSALPASGGRIVLREVTEADTGEEDQASGGTAAESRTSDLARVAGLRVPASPCCSWPSRSCARGCAKAWRR